MGQHWGDVTSAKRADGVEAMAESPKVVSLVLRLIGELYLREREWDTANVGAARAALRHEHFARPLRWLRRLAIGLRTRHLPRSLVGKACAYLLDNWEPLTAHLRHSESRLDNNLVENAIRVSVALERNSGSHTLQKKSPAGREAANRRAPTRRVAHCRCELR